MPDLPESAEVVIIGAGFAGSSTAYHLTRMGIHDILILERESIPGAQASGRNAAMLRRIVGLDPFGLLCNKGADRILSQPESTHQVERNCGSLLLCSTNLRRQFDQIVKQQEAKDSPCRWLTPYESTDQLSILEGSHFDSALHVPRDGILDLQGLLHFFLRGARSSGCRLFTSTPVLKIRSNRKGVHKIHTPRQTVETRKVINAAGAWAGQVASLSDAFPMNIQPFRRHLFRLTPGPSQSDHLPWVWDLGRSFYLRPDTGGWIASFCDEDPHLPCPPRVAPQAAFHLANTLTQHLPLARELSVDRSWACLRTFTPDRQPLIGPDPKLPGFYWSAGLGGHGVTTSHLIGELTARTIMGQPLEKPFDQFTPSRYR
jgi:glycine/D-amino acid oxidase-like deaminating enzyme